MKILTYDHGLCLEAALTLSRAGHSIGYYVPNDDAFPKPTKALIGSGMEDIERVKDSDWDKAFERAEAIFCPDTRSKKVVDQARREGKPVWGAGEAEVLELDRAYMKKTMLAHGMPVGPYRLVKGIEPLIALLKTTKDVWVKVSSGEYRGVIETFHHPSWNATQAQVIGQLLIDFGAVAPEIEFLIEEPLKGAECGSDGFIFRGTPLGTLYGYERKDEAYIGRDVATLPDALRKVREKLCTMQECYRAITFCSTEVIGDKLIDPTLRAPHPPLAGMLNLYPSWPLLVERAMDERHPPTLAPVTPYVAVLVIRSEWAADHQTEIEFPERLRRSIKLSWAFHRAGHFFALPGNTFVAYAVGLGATAQAAAREAKKVADEIHCREKIVRQSALDELLDDVIPKGRNENIPF